MLVGLSVPFAYLFSGFEVGVEAGIPGLALLAAFLVTLGLAGSYAGTLAHRFVLSALKARASKASG